MAPRYSEAEPDLNFAHPLLLPPPEAGGEYGQAPVVGGEVVYENGAWRVTELRFHTADAMFLSSVLLLKTGGQVDFFTPAEQLRVAAKR